MFAVSASCLALILALCVCVKRARSLTGRMLKIGGLKGSEDMESEVGGNKLTGVVADNSQRLVRALSLRSAHLPR